MSRWSLPSIPLCLPVCDSGASPHVAGLPVTVPGPEVPHPPLHNLTGKWRWVESLFCRKQQKKETKKTPSSYVFKIKAEDEQGHLTPWWQESWQIWHPAVRLSGKCGGDPQGNSRRGRRPWLTGPSLSLLCPQLTLSVLESSGAWPVWPLSLCPHIWEPTGAAGAPSWHTNPRSQGGFAM